MKAVLLAAGYGTRLQRDVAADSSGKFAHLAGVAKPLLPVGHRPLVSHWVQALTASGCVDRVYVVTNAVYQAAFEDWAADFSNVRILSDQTKTNDVFTPSCSSNTQPHLINLERSTCHTLNRKLYRPYLLKAMGRPKERLGAVSCLQLTVKHFCIEDHLVVIGGDTLFREDFSLSQVVEKFSDVQERVEDSCLVLSYPCRDEETQKYGILEVDEDLRVLCMKEKPLPVETTSRRACPCFYVLSKNSLPLLDVFLEEKKEAAIEEKDAPGNFVSWLIARKPVYVHQISGRFDVGNLPSYVECDLYFKEKLRDAKSYLV